MKQINVIMLNSKTQMARRASVAKLAPTVQTTNEDLTAHGAVIAMGHYSANTPLSNFSVSLTSASGASKNFIVGDPLGIIADALSGTYVTPDAASCLVEGMKQAFQSAPIAVRGINYKVTTSATQFNNAMKYVTCDIDGQLNQRELRPAIAERNSMQNTKLLTLDFSNNPLILNSFSALTLTVNDGEDVYLDFTVAAAAGRA